jgi:diaminohydroxyphosphoribosylaminopyrimidine deaminase/5-amino-6-(5-phosphoribosylamino)uracil reductase
MTDADAVWMRRALELAVRGRGFVEPNPLVGAVVVRDGRLVGEGWHQRYGEAHAEVQALAAAGEATRGATLYVTLEPCCHHGKTPPCTDAILRAGIGRVVAAMEDPFPQVAGKGTALLRSAGVPVECDLLEREARRLNAPYRKLLATGRPYVHAKWAMTLDGKIATRTGDSKWISNEASRRRVHELRGRMDAIVVGRQTAVMDDPLLTARPPGPRTATRVVLDSQGRLPRSLQLVRTARQVPTLVVTAGEPREDLQGLGVEVLRLPGETDRPEIGRLLDELGRRRMTNVLVEGGSRVLGSFHDAQAIDEAHVFIAPRVLGGGEALTPVGGFGAATIADGLALAGARFEMLDGDILFCGWKTEAGS